MSASDALALLRRFFVPTPLVHSEQLSRVTGGEVHLKLERDLPTASFKVRGALFSLSQRIQRQAVAEVVAASTGNHGSAVAFAASTLGRSATIFLPVGANPVKRSWIESFGAQIVEHGRDLTAARAAAEAHALRNAAFLLDDAEDPDIPHGVATIALEIAVQLADVDEMFVPVGDSALIRGVGTAMRALQPRTRISGVQAAKAPAYYLSWQAGRVITTEHCDTIADGLATRTPTAENVAAMRDCVDDMQLVSEDEMLQAVHLLADEGIVAEPSGAAGLAAVLNQRARLAGRRIVILITGGNLDPAIAGRLPG
ncbi:MAG TPA: threonine/serine dehydratase [Gemmatimonadaceae bacterium]